MDLKQFFTQNPKAAIAFSGGVDSVYLLWAAKKYGTDIRAYYVKTAFQPEFELEDAKRAARELKADMRVIELSILNDEKIIPNPCNRCYYCKKKIFSAIAQSAKEDGYELILDGTNASDDADDRPGMKALEELSIQSPLRLCGLGKEKIRALSHEAGLFTYNKPAYACLATRIPCGERITSELLFKIEQGENVLFSLGFSDFRIRIFHGAARIQLRRADISKAAQMFDKIKDGLCPYFDTVLLDLKCRNIQLNKFHVF